MHSDPYCMITSSSQIHLLPPSVTHPPLQSIICFNLFLMISFHLLPSHRLLILYTVYCFSFHGYKTKTRKPALIKLKPWRWNQMASPQYKNSSIVSMLNRSGILEVCMLLQCSLDYPTLFPGTQVNTFTTVYLDRVELWFTVE